MFTTPRRYRIAGRIAAIAVAAWAASMLTPAAASATAPTTIQFTDQGSGTIDCGTFSDNFVDYFTITETTFYDEQGNVTRVVDQVVHTSDDVNSVTGFTLHEHGHATLTFNPATGQFTIDGSLLVMTRPGYGIVVIAVGRIVVITLRSENGAPAVVVMPWAVAGRLGVTSSWLGRDRDRSGTVA